MNKRATIADVAAQAGVSKATVSKALNHPETSEISTETVRRVQAAAKALGDAKWALLANHGSLVVGRDLRQAHLRAITLEWRSMRAIEVEQAGGGVALTEAQVAAIARPDAHGFPFLWEAMARRELREDPGILE